jgi:hypothetical protein
MKRLLQSATGEVVLAAGEHDHMVTRERLTRLHKLRSFPDRGHNVRSKTHRASGS